MFENQLLLDWMCRGESPFAFKAYRGTPFRSRLSALSPVATKTCPRHIFVRPSIPFKSKQKAVLCTTFRFGGAEGNRSRLQAGKTPQNLFCGDPMSGSALTCPRHVIHFRPVRFPVSCTRKQKQAKPFRARLVFILVEPRGIEPLSENPFTVFSPSAVLH